MVGGQRIYRAMTRSDRAVIRDRAAFRYDQRLRRATIDDRYLPFADAPPKRTNDGMGCDTPAPPQPAFDSPRPESVTAPAYIDPAVEFAKGLPFARPMPDREFTAPESLPGTVYIVLHDAIYLATSELKIGFSRVPANRIKEPQRWSPGFRMVASVQVSDMRAAEDELHRTFENARCT
ncbi:hypothetical protein LCGC14_2971970, partial [marine sediment metagenome]